MMITLNKQYCLSAYPIVLNFMHFTHACYMYMPYYSLGTGESYGPNSPTYARLSNLLYTAELCT